MSMSIDSRLLVFSCNIRELPPLNTNGHPERAKASSKENALIVFSAKAKSRIPRRAAASVIHSIVLLLGFIIVYCIYNMFYFIFSVTARCVSEQFAQIHIVPLMDVFIYIVYFRAACKRQLIIT